MIISLIAAMAKNRVIGRENSMPWNIPSDRRRFRTITWGHPVLFGRKTFAGLARPLPGRRNIVLTRNPAYRAPGAVVAHDLASAFAACEDADEVFICGGGMVFGEAIALADRIYVAVIHREYDGDTYFPEIPGDFVEISREELDEAIPYGFYRYERKKR